MELITEMDGPAGWGTPLYERVLDALGVGPALLDVGCGDGRLLRLAADRGAVVTGVDPDPARLARASALVPAAALHRAEASELPLPAALAPAVACVQVLMHVPNPLAALRELARVGAPGGRVAVTVWGPPMRCAIGVFGAAFAPLLGTTFPPPRRSGDASGPPPLEAQDRLARLVGLAGMRVVASEEVCCPFGYPDQDSLLTSAFTSELGRRARVVAGAKPARRAVLAAAEPYRQSDGGYRLENTFRLVAGEFVRGSRTRCAPR